VTTRRPGLLLDPRIISYEGIVRGLLRLRERFSCAGYDMTNITDDILTARDFCSVRTLEVPIDSLVLVS
jgi:hypothetical protein